MALLLIEVFIDDFATLGLPDVEEVARHFLDGLLQLVEVLLEGFLLLVKFEDVPPEQVHERQIRQLLQG